jgi:hypothetical protein
VYLVATLLEVLLPAGTSAAARLNTIIQLSIFFAVVCLLAGSTLPLWGPRVGVPTFMRQLRMLVAYWRLRSLWHALVAEAPTVILPVPVRWRSTLFAPESLDLLLYRRVIEILDAWRELDGIRELHEAVAPSSKHAPRSGAPGPVPTHVRSQRTETAARARRTCRHEGKASSALRAPMPIILWRHSSICANIQVARKRTGRWSRG